MKILKRLLLFFSLVLLYFIAKEFVSFYQFFRSIHPIAGYASLVAIVIFVFYFVVSPIIQIIKLPKSYSPTSNEDEVDDILKHRIEYFRTNEYLSKTKFDFLGIQNDKKSYEKIVEQLQPESERIRKKYVSTLFYSSTISQNGFLDAILILSSSVNLVKEIFILYQGRVSNRDLWEIAKKVYYSMAIGGSEGVTYAADEIFSKFATGGVKSIPFADKIFSSLADGFINAALLTRISLITENYCKLVYIKSNKDLYPSPGFIATTTKFLVSDITEKLFDELVKMSKEKTGDLLKITVYPVRYVLAGAWTKVIETTEKVNPIHKDSLLKEVAILSTNQIGYGFSKLTGLFRRKK